MKTIPDALKPTAVIASNQLSFDFTAFAAVFGIARHRIMAIIDNTLNQTVYALGKAGLGGTLIGNILIVTGSGINPITMGIQATDYFTVIYDYGLPHVVLDAPEATNPSGWPSKFHLCTLAGTNATNIKATGGTVGGIFFTQGYQGGAPLSDTYLKIYDKATAPTVGTDVPALVIPCSYTTSYGVFTPAAGIKFINGISIATVVGAADSATGITQANMIIDIIFS